MHSPFALDDLCLVRAIGEAGTLTGAARRLKVDHSTAFRRLGVVEERLGVRLFERARDGYTPTSAGEVAIETAARILDEIGDLERRLAGEDLRPSGIVRLTTADTLLELVGPILADLRVAHPAITIELVADNSFLTLTKRDADIALRAAATVPENLSDGGSRCCQPHRMQHPPIWCGNPITPNFRHMSGSASRKV